VFQKHRETATGDIEQRKKAIEALLTPVTATLEEYRKGLSELEKSRLEAYAGLSTELKGVALAQAEVRNETSRLVNALRAAPKTRGRWGEEQLRNVMELSGMSAYVDFQTEVTFDRDDEKLRPDVIITMPGARHIVVDAKTSMSGYLEALDAPDEENKEACLKKHAVQVRKHMKELSAKSYWDSLSVTPDFVVMFIPGENFFAAAIERDPGLFEDGVKGRVLIATPTTLVALAKAIAFGWRQEKVAENAQKVSELGRELYKRLAIMGEHVTSVGTHLDRSVKAYNKFVGSLETSVFPQARKFTEYSVEGTQEPLPEIEELETDVRQVRGRDLALPAAEPTPLLEIVPSSEA
jgi:DNA recombination protein RmuC